MILGFSNYIPFVDAPNKSIKTNFKSKCIEGEKKHTFRAMRKDGKVWKKGDKIHFYGGGSPRNGGAPFGIRVRNAEDWLFIGQNLGTTTRKHPSLSGYQDFMPGHKVGLPLVSGVESFRFERHEFAGATDLILHIEDVFIFHARLEMQHLNNVKKPANETWDCKEDGQKELLCEISKNDGLTPLYFLKWFRHSMRKNEVKVFEGQIIHWTPLRYVASTDATIIDS